MNKKLPTPNATCAQVLPLPDYRLLFLLHTWTENTLADWPRDLSEPDELISNLNFALGCMVEMAMCREFKTYTEMLEGIHRGEFDRD